jgi:hypothetical protein
MVDSLGYRSHLVRELDLVFLEQAGLEGSPEAGKLVFSVLKEKVRDIVWHTFHWESCWWPQALLSACSWAVHFMECPRGRVHLLTLARYFQRLNRVSAPFRKASLSLVLKCKDALRRSGSTRQLPAEFDLRREVFEHGDDYKPLDIQALPHCPFL